MADEPLEPITLKALIESFASTVVATSHHLDQASVDLRSLYLTSGLDGLGSLVPPRFALDEVAIDLAFVVAQAKPEAPSKVPPTGNGFQERPVQLSVRDKQAVEQKLSLLVLQDAQRMVNDGLVAAAARRQSISERLDQNKQEMDRTLAEISVAQSQPISILNPATGIRAHMLTIQMRALEEEARGLQAESASVEEFARTVNASFEVVQKSPGGMRTPEIEELARTGLNLTDDVANWSMLQGEYNDLKNTYSAATAAFEGGKGLSKIGDFSLSPEEERVLARVIGRGQAETQAEKQTEIAEAGWLSIRTQVSDLRADYLATLHALNALVRQVADSKGAGLQVRVDPAALQAAPLEARHRLRLTFRGQTRENVKVGDKDVDIAS